MSDGQWKIDNAADALLFCDYLAKFGSGDVVQFYAGLAKVIRELMHRLEDQALQMERTEAFKDSAR